MSNPIDERMVIGTIGELLVQLRLLQYGVQAAPPIKDTGNDLVALRGREVRSIQVRTTSGGTFPRLPAAKKIYDILAIVDLRGHDQTLQLDCTNIFLIPKDRLSTVPRNLAMLDGYRLEKVVNACFGGPSSKRRSIGHESKSRRVGHQTIIHKPHQVGEAGNMEAMSWKELQNRIRRDIRPQRSRILKADGKGRRLVTSNRGQKIGMQTGAKSNQTKAITYTMIEHAFHTLATKGAFDSTDFRARFGTEYSAAPCRFSMTGGVLVELGIADIMPSSNEGACRYVDKSQT